MDKLTIGIYQNTKDVGNGWKMYERSLFKKVCNAMVGTPVEPWDKRQRWKMATKSSPLTNILMMRWNERWKMKQRANIYAYISTLPNRQANHDDGYAFSLLLFLFSLFFSCVISENHQKHSFQCFSFTWRSFGFEYYHFRWEVYLLRYRLSCTSIKT